MFGSYFLGGNKPHRYKSDGESMTYLKPVLYSDLNILQYI